MALSKSTQELGSDSPDLKEESLKHQAKVVKEEVSHKTREEEEDKEEEGDRGEGEREGREGDGEGDGKGGDGEGDEGEGEKKEKAAVHIMEPNVRNAVFTIFPTTGLQKKEQNGHWTIKQDEMGSDAKENEQIDFRDQDPKTDGRWTRRDVLGERSRQMEKSVNGQPDLWTPPQDRDSRLAVVKSGSLYDVRAYKAEKKPSRLYGEDDADELPYRIPPEELSPEKAQELEAERQEVIKSQTVWKSTTVAERQSTSPSYTAVFAVCFDSAPADPENVDTEQISFAAARQQFLALEKTSPNVLQQCGSPRRTQTMPGVGIIGSHEQRDLSTSRGHGQVSLGETRPGVKVVIIDERVSRKYTGRPPDPKDGVEAAEETPIEREIRLSQEREEELWKERGIPRTTDCWKARGIPKTTEIADGVEATEETPIEREIRLSQEREEELWKERGIPRTTDLWKVHGFPSTTDPVDDVEGTEETLIEREIRLSLEREKELWKEHGIPRTTDLWKARGIPKTTETADGVEGAEETLIEREIRLSLEREEELWKERGIPRTTDTADGVEATEETPNEQEIRLSVERENHLQKEHEIPRTTDLVDSVEAAEETPIEREIRLSQEREEELWKERGIPRTSSRDELIEIRTKPLLWSSSSTDGKEKPRVSFPVQREIEQEARREEDLQKEGRLPGTYSRGERQQLAQRRKVFEPCKTMISGASERPNRGERRVADQDVKRSSEARDNEPFLLASGMGSSRPTFPNSGDSGEGFVMQKAHVVSQMGSPRPTFLNSGDSGEGLVMQKAHVASQMDSPRPTSPNSVDPGEGLVMQKAHFAIPVRKLRFGTKVEEHGGAPKRHEVFTLKTWRPRTSALIDQEIRDALRRELELQEERRNAGLAATAEPRSPNPARTGFAGCTSPISSSSSSGRMSALASPDRLSSRKPSSESGFQTCLSPSMRRREDGKYAGIELSDEIDTEVVRSTKAICRRGVLAQRWEAGEIRNARSHDEDDDSDSRD
nr:PREDICTED: mitotic interactor and substrate of PLK1 isoform X1 [Anolis carolinensis]|eukprot:XP_008122622.2 PREDICTED: mitotic interactor and substrate of PLK1 isoform X1 [Anolis carolinensis]